MTIPSGTMGGRALPNQKKKKRNPHPLHMKMGIQPGSCALRLLARQNPFFFCPDSLCMFWTQGRGTGQGRWVEVIRGFFDGGAVH